MNIHPCTAHNGNNIHKKSNPNRSVSNWLLHIHPIERLRKFGGGGGPICSGLRVLKSLYFFFGIPLGFLGQKLLVNTHNVSDSEAFHALKSPNANSWNRCGGDRLCGVDGLSLRRLLPPYESIKSSS